MENENYYLVIFKEEIIGVINEKELIELEKEDRIRNNKNINIAKIAKSNVNDILKKDLIKALDRKESRECIDDLSPYSLFEDKLKRDKEKSRTNYLGRERE